MENSCCLMTIAYPGLLLRGGRFVGSRDGKSGKGEFARICRRRRSCDSFRNRPYGQPILSCPKKNEGMSEGFAQLVKQTWPGMQIHSPEINARNSELSMFCLEGRLTR